MLLQYYTILKQ